MELVKTKEVLVSTQQDLFTS